MYYYDTPEKLENDYELQQWRDELVKERHLTGVGLKVRHINCTNKNSNVVLDIAPPDTRTNGVANPVGFHSLLKKLGGSNGDIVCTYIHP
ncbi:unnamed protein product [Ixodes pacificus]